MPKGPRVTIRFVAQDPSSIEEYINRFGAVTEMRTGGDIGVGRWVVETRDRIALMHPHARKRGLAHIVISWEPQDLPSQEEAFRYATQVLRAYGWDERYIVAGHVDTDHRHLHVVATRAGGNGRVLDKARLRDIPRIQRAIDRSFGYQSPPSRERLAAPVRQAEAWNARISVTRWLQQRIAQEGAQTPQEIVAVLAREGFGIVRRGAGAVVVGGMFHVKRSALFDATLAARLPVAEHPDPAWEGQGYAAFCREPESLTPFARAHPALDATLARERSRAGAWRGLGYELRRHGRTQEQSAIMSTTIETQEKETAPKELITKPKSTRKTPKRNQKNTQETIVENIITAPEGAVVDHQRSAGQQAIDAYYNRLATLFNPITATRIIGAYGGLYRSLTAFQRANTAQSWREAFLEVRRDVVSAQRVILATEYEKGIVVPEPCPELAQEYNVPGPINWTTAIAATAFTFHETRDEREQPILQIVNGKAEAQYRDGAFAFTQRPLVLSRQDASDREALEDAALLAMAAKYQGRVGIQGSNRFVTAVAKRAAHLGIEVTGQGRAVWEKERAALHELQERKPDELLLSTIDHAPDFGEGKDSRSADERALEEIAARIGADRYTDTDPLDGSLVAREGDIAILKNDRYEFPLLVHLREETLNNVSTIPLGAPVQFDNGSLTIHEHDQEQDREQIHEQEEKREPTDPSQILDDL